MAASFGEIRDLLGVIDSWKWQINEIPIAGCDDDLPGITIGYEHLYTDTKLVCHRSKSCNLFYNEKATKMNVISK